MQQQIRWEPRAAEISACGAVRIHCGMARESREQALADAEKMFDELGNDGVWCSAVRLQMWN